MIARELIIRLNIINGRHWRNFFIICFCLALSALYELLEWWVALLSEEAAEAFLGMQGYEWDTQSDMGYAFIGAVAALLLLSKLHDKQLKEYT
jgi:putative membrane protein